MIESRDSNFILGSVGTGDATLTINGSPVTVRPNGAFLAWLPVPDSASSRYDLVAVAGTDTARLSYPVKLLPSRRALEDSATADSIAFLRQPFPDSGQYVRLEPRDTSMADTDRVIIARPIPGGTYKWFLLPGTVVQVTGRSPGFERVRLDSELDVWVSPHDIAAWPPPAALAFAAPGPSPRPNATPPSPALRVTTLPPSTQPLVAEHAPRRIIGAVRVVPTRQWVDVVFTMNERPPYLVEEDGNNLEVTFYGTEASTDLIQYVAPPQALPGTPDTLVRTVTWSQVMSDRARYRVELSQAPYGYLVLWTPSGFVLRVRRPPAINPAGPLRGLTIVVDAGHPPAGSTGPTGLYEGVATLAIAQRLDSLLIARGATVVMTRTTQEPVALGSRPILARRVNADAMVSIHLNALPDGMNPFTSHGTGTYFFHPHSIELARTVETGLVRSLGLRDLGVHYDNLAVARPTWMPAILCEGAFVIIPEQEAALRTPAFQTAYARGVVDGLAAYFHELAALPDHVQPVSAVPAATPPATASPKASATAAGQSGH